MPAKCWLELHIRRSCETNTAMNPVPIKTHSHVFAANTQGAQATTRVHSAVPLGVLPNPAKEERRPSRRGASTLLCLRDLRFSGPGNTLEAQSSNLRAPEATGVSKIAARLRDH